MDDIINSKFRTIENESNLKDKSSLTSLNNEHSIVELSAPNVDNSHHNDDNCSEMSDSVS